MGQLVSVFEPKQRREDVGETGGGGGTDEREDDVDGGHEDGQDVAGDHQEERQDDEADGDFLHLDVADHDAADEQLGHPWRERRGHEIIVFITTIIIIALFCLIWVVLI